MRGQGEPLRPLGIRVLGLILTSIAFSVSFTEEAHVSVPIIMLCE